MSEHILYLDFLEFIIECFEVKKAKYNNYIVTTTTTNDNPSSNDYLVDILKHVIGQFICQERQGFTSFTHTIIPAASKMQDKI